MTDTNILSAVQSLQESEKSHHKIIIGLLVVLIIVGIIFHMYYNNCKSNFIELTPEEYSIKKQQLMSMGGTSEARVDAWMKRLYRVKPEIKEKYSGGFPGVPSETPGFDELKRLEKHDLPDIRPYRSTKMIKEGWENWALPSDKAGAIRAWKAAGVSDDEILWLVDTYYPREEYKNSFRVPSAGELPLYVQPGPSNINRSHKEGFENLYTGHGDDMSIRSEPLIPQHDEPRARHAIMTMGLSRTDATRYVNELNRGAHDYNMNEIPVEKFSGSPQYANPSLPMPSPQSFEDERLPGRPEGVSGWIQERMTMRTNDLGIPAMPINEKDIQEVMQHFNLSQEEAIARIKKMHKQWATLFAEQQEYENANPVHDITLDYPWH